MTLQDKAIQCSDCGVNFVFTAGEQEFFATKGYANEPKRCPTCRQSRRSTHSGEGNFNSGSTRQLFPAVCAECGKDTQVPFEPRLGRPVYCSDCYSKMRPDRQR
ncbi:MAG: zinc-ribbon domain containing protein [Chloroflexi bacterium]|nr:zinc-ribbon domain containing protein [Chloroflexota bacterium]